MNAEAEAVLWRRETFSIDGVDAEFQGWTSGERWNGWEMPYFEFMEAQKVVELLTEPKAKVDAERDRFIGVNSDGKEEVWRGELIPALGGQQTKVYGVGAGAWTRELSSG